MQKINMTVGRFQPFTQGHLNMVNEGDGPCIIYQIKPAEMPKSIADLKIKGKKAKKEQIQKVLQFLNHEDVKLTEDEKELLKRPFTNELVTKELELIQKSNPNIVDIVYVKNMYDALDLFNAFCTDLGDEYEPQYWMCGDDRVDTYSKEIGRYDELETSLGSGEKIPNILKGRLLTNTGKGRTEGVSGTTVRASIINDDKDAFTKIMPKGVGKMFNEFKKAFSDYTELLQGIIKEWKTTSLKDYIFESVKTKTVNGYEVNLDVDDVFDIADDDTLADLATDNYEILPIKAKRIISNANINILVKGKKWIIVNGSDLTSDTYKKLIKAKYIYYL